MYHLYVFGNKKEKARSRDQSVVKTPVKKKKKRKEDKVYEMNYEVISSSCNICEKRVDTGEVLCNDCKIDAV